MVINGFMGELDVEKGFELYCQYQFLKFLLFRSVSQKNYGILSVTFNKAGTVQPRSQSSRGSRGTRGKYWQ